MEQGKGGWDLAKGKGLRKTCLGGRGQLQAPSRTERPKPGHRCLGHGFQEPELPSPAEQRGRSRVIRAWDAGFKSLSLPLARRWGGYLGGTPALTLVPLSLWTASLNRAGEGASSSSGTRDQPRESECVHEGVGVHMSVSACACVSVCVRTCICAHAAHGGEEQWLGAGLWPVHTGVSEPHVIEEDAHSLACL